MTFGHKRCAYLNERIETMDNIMQMRFDTKNREIADLRARVAAQSELLNALLDYFALGIEVPTQRTRLVPRKKVKA